VVLLDEVADVDLLPPETGSEAAPRGLFAPRFGFGCHGKLLARGRYVRTPARPSNDAVCRAIISSSFVGITHADTRLSGREMRGPPDAFASGSSSMPIHADASQIRRRISADFSPMPAVKTSASTPPST